MRDINHRDKQNFQAVINITSAAHLLSKVPDADATKCYVELIQCVMDSYLDKSLDSLTRIEKIWYVTFFMRYWWKWLMLNKGYTLKDHFVTSNAYMCIEMNAHALIVFLMTVREYGANCFLPWLLGSQVCEAIFRTARSVSSIFSTTINFGMLGLLQRLCHLHIQLALQADSSEEILFPRTVKHKVQEQSFNLLEVTNAKIDEAVKKGQKRAEEMVQKLGMTELFKKHSLWGRKISIVGIDGGTHKNSDCDADNDCDADSDSDDNGEDDGVNLEGLQNVACFNEDISIHESIQVSEDLKRMTENNIVDNALQQKMQKQQKIFYKQIPSSTIPMYQQVETSDDSKQLQKEKLKSISTMKKFNPFVEVITSSNKKILIRKTTSLWLLQEGEWISADRLFRVKYKQPYSDHVSDIKTSQKDKPIIIADPPSNDIVVIDDNNDTNFSTQWLKIGGISLYDSDKQII